jgi:hypothetical protein
MPDNREELVDESQEQDKGLCPSCQGKLRNKGKRRKRLGSVAKKMF